MLGSGKQELELIALTGEVAAGAGGAPGASGQRQAEGGGLRRRCRERARACGAGPPPGGRLKLCARCQSALVRYCGAQCKTQHWPAHKAVCRAQQKAAAA